MYFKWFHLFSYSILLPWPPLLQLKLKIKLTSLSPNLIIFPKNEKFGRLPLAAILSWLEAVAASRLHSFGQCSFLFRGTNYHHACFLLCFSALKIWYNDITITRFRTYQQHEKQHVEPETSQINAACAVICGFKVAQMSLIFKLSKWMSGKELTVQKKMTILMKSLSSSCNWMVRWVDEMTLKKNC